MALPLATTTAPAPLMSPEIVPPFRVARVATASAVWTPPPFTVRELVATEPRPLTTAPVTVRLSVNSVAPALMPSVPLVSETAFKFAVSAVTTGLLANTPEIVTVPAATGATPVFQLVAVEKTVSVPPVQDCACSACG